MTASLTASLLVTLVVWVVSMIRSVWWRALVYSLPLPITLVLVTTRVSVDGSQLLGVIALNIFFAVVALLHARWGWPVALADVSGVLVYVGLSWLIASLAPIPFWPVLAAVCALWGLVTLTLPPNRASVAAPPQTRPGAVVKLGTVFGASLLMVTLGRQLKGLIVTFPYSGVLVVIEARSHLGEFTRHFTRNSIGLVAFFGGYHLLQGRGRPIALVGGWLAFVVCALLLHLRRTGRHPGRGIPVFSWGWAMRLGGRETRQRSAARPGKPNEPNDPVG